MNVDLAKRIVALRRTASGYRAMQRKGDLTPLECDALIAATNAEIARIRSQDDLQLEPGASPPPAPKGAVK